MDKDRKIQMEVKTAEVEKIIKSENDDGVTFGELLFPHRRLDCCEKNKTFSVGSRFTWFIYRESFGLKIVFKLPGELKL